MQGGAGWSGGGNGGDVYVQGGDASAGNGGAVFIQGGDTDAATENPGANVEISGGAGYGGGDVIITPGGNGVGSDGSVRIRRRSGASSGAVLLDDAFVNGTGTTGQVLTSNGGSSPPSWQGSAGGTASLGAFRYETTASITVTLSDYCVTASPTTSTVNLPASASVPTGRIFVIKSRRSAGNVAVTPNGTDRIDGLPGIRNIGSDEALRLMRTNTSNTEWIVI